jgi:hypothetical protein
MCDFNSQDLPSYMGLTYCPVCGDMIIAGKPHIDYLRLEYIPSPRRPRFYIRVIGLSNVITVLCPEFGIFHLCSMSSGELKIIYGKGTSEGIKFVCEFTGDEYNVYPYINDQPKLEEPFPVEVYKVKTP